MKPNHLSITGILIAVFVLVGCSPGDDGVATAMADAPAATESATATTLPTSTFTMTSQTPTVEPTLSPTATTPPDIFYADRSLLLFYPSFRHTNLIDEVWSTTYPFTSAQQLLAEPGYYFSSPSWSHDGQLLAYVRSKEGNPIPESSLWIGQSDGYEAHQIGPIFRGRSNEYTLVSPATLQWSPSDEWLVVSLRAEGMNEGAYLLSPVTGELFPVEFVNDFQDAGIYDRDEYHHASWLSFSPVGDLALLTTVDSDGISSPISQFFSGLTLPSLFVYNLDTQVIETILEPPSEMSFVYEDNGYVRSMSLHGGISWTLDGRSLLFSDQTQDAKRLWLVNLESGEWEQTLSQPHSVSGAEPQRFRSIEWSPDGEWIAWWENEDALDFVNATTWEVVRSVPLGREDSSPYRAPAGWEQCTSGDNCFAIWRSLSDGIGLYLYHPFDESQDQLILAYDDLASIVPYGDFVMMGFRTLVVED